VVLRVTSSLLLLAGLLLIVTWGARPAESQSTPNPPRPSRAVGLGLPAELADVNAEVERLTDRLDRDVVFPPPSRDLFNFGTRASARRDVVAPPESIDPVGVPPAPPAWPSLVAIMESGESVEVALADALGELQVVKAGGTFGAFLVSDVTRDAVVISDPVSGQSTRLTVR
jgi:hypothetical protein